MMTIKSQRFHRPPSIVPPNPRSASDWHLLILVILVIGTEQTPLQSASVHQWPSCGASQMSYRKEKYGKLIERRIQIKTFCLLSGGPLNVSFTAAENNMSTSLMRPSEFIEIQRIPACWFAQSDQMLPERFFFFCLVDPDRVAFHWAAVKNACLLQLFIILSVSAADSEHRAFKCMMGRTAASSVLKGKLSQDTINEWEDVMMPLRWVTCPNREF